MTIILNGTTGITTPDITSSGSLNIDASAPDNSLVVDSAGNVGIGTSSPTVPLTVEKNGGGGDSGQIMRVTDTNTANSVGPTSLTVGMMNHYAPNPHMCIAGTTGLSFCVGDGSDFVAQRKVEIDSSGNLLAGTTGISTGTFKGIQCGVNSGGFPNYLSNNPAGTANRNWSFGMNNSDQYAVYGYNTTTFNTGAYIAWGGTSWTASSDERKKDIIEPIENGLQKVSTLRAVIGKYKTDEEGTRRSFLIAQDVQAVLPEAVDASNPDDLGVQYTEIIPLLVASIKELKVITDTQQALIEALTARVSALEAK